MVSTLIENYEAFARFEARDIMVHRFTMLLTYIHSVNVHVQYHRFVIDRQILTHKENENVKSQQAEIV